MRVNNPLLPNLKKKVFEFCTTLQGPNNFAAGLLYST